ncbi:hypothetical protein PHYSODRAFT_341850 [Phytophthora sojae]|uniref:Chromo domain-containing protein n=1 Tax=Phytophthora sojae (strain P6497) TaxID=1094619 RepID=G5AEK2_PHYSP|nr:hypothetical protein PHYSODRAFT_341850 [Phytophthora sojae]EGZ06604.1 hypothetical protein PHYSODRAFT_341850 [Phytophthora sojae]|eukprot:XP_009538501.1 hypothetical protein PHYSODRAFT_341850 [Phytophthora sojae]
MAYRPQANGTADRMVQTATRALNMFVEDLDQRDWDEYAERLTFAINTAQDRVCGDSPFYLVHGWDPRSTLEAAIPLGTRTRDRDHRRWRYRIQKLYDQARSQVNARLREAITDRADRHNEEVRPQSIEAGSQVWLYLDRVKEGYARKLAHLWHSPFRVAEKVNEYTMNLQIAGTDYHLFPIVHVSKLKLVRDFPDRPQIALTVDEADRLDFGEVLLPEDSWAPDRDSNECEVEKITDTRTGRRTRYGRTYREFLVHWKGYDEPDWVDEADLNCGALLHQFLRDRVNRNGLGAMQSHEEESDDYGTTTRRYDDGSGLIGLVAKGAAAAAAGLNAPGLSPADLRLNARLCRILAQRFPEVMDTPTEETRRVELTIHPRADGAATTLPAPVSSAGSFLGQSTRLTGSEAPASPSESPASSAANPVSADAVSTPVSTSASRRRRSKSVDEVHRRKPKKPFEQPYACPLPGEVGHEDALVQLEKAAQETDAACDLSLRSSLNLAGLTVDDANVEAGDEVHSLEEDLSFEFTEVPGSAELPRGPAGPTVSVPSVQLVPYSSSPVQTPSSGVAVVPLPGSADLATIPSVLSLPASVPFPTRVRWVPSSTSVPSAAVVTSTAGAGGQPGSSAPDPALATTHAVIAPSSTAGVSAAGTINSSAAIPPRVSQSSPGSAAHRLLACTRSRFANQAQSRRGPSGVASTVVTPMPSTPSVASTRPAVPPSSAGMTSPSGRPLRSTAATARVLNAHCLDLLETRDYLVLRSARRSSSSGLSGSALGLNAPGTSAHPLSVSESSESEADDPGSADELSSADPDASRRASLASALPPPHGKLQSYMAARQSPLVPSSEPDDSDSQPSSKKQSGKGKRKRRRKHKHEHEHKHKHKSKSKSKSKSAGSKKSKRSASPDSAKDPRPSKRQRGSTGDSAGGLAGISAASSSTGNSAGSSGIPSSSAVSPSPISAGPASTLSVPIVTAHDAGAHVLPQLPAALRHSLAQLRTLARQAVGRDARITPQLAQLRDICFVHYGSWRCWEAILSHQTAKVTVDDASGKGSVPVTLCFLAGIKAFADVYHPDHPAQRLLRLLPKTPIFFSRQVLDDAKRRLANSVKSVTLMERLAEVFVKIRGEAPNSVCDKAGPTKFFVALFERCHWMVESSVLMGLHPAFHTGLPYHVIAEMYDTWALYKLARKGRGDALRSLMTTLPDDMFTAVMKLLGGLAAPEIDAELFFEPSDAIEEDMDLDEPAPLQISSSAPVPANRAGIHTFKVVKSANSAGLLVTWIRSSLFGPASPRSPAESSAGSSVPLASDSAIPTSSSADSAVPTGEAADSSAGSAASTGGSIGLLAAAATTVVSSAAHSQGSSSP